MNIKEQLEELRALTDVGLEPHSHSFRDACEEAAKTIEMLLKNLDVARGALADIGLNEDMTRKQIQHKANRIYAGLFDQDNAELE